MDAAPPAATAPHLDSVLEGIVEPVLVLADGQVEAANTAARELLGNHIVGQDVRLAIRHPAAAERLTAPPGTGAAGPINLVGLGTLDQRWELRVTDTPDRRRVVHLIDQTGSYAAERMRVDFVANASHELRTPLASILGFAETLSENDGADPTMRARFLKVMVDEARRMQRLVEDLISLSRIEAEKYRLPDASIDLGALLNEVVVELTDTHDPRAADIAVELAGDVPPVAGDRIQLSQALHNLIGNAMKYGRAGTPVAVKLWRYPNGMVRLSVGDEGDGIAPEHIPRLTERFYRVDSGRSRAVGGTGLGLAIVKHVVERHRGRLDIASQVGRGTVVTILLPAEQGVIKG
ncbi:MAG: ATPase [Sphingomonas sp.]|uniref:ATP-binding protein n=1 Tax=Sphingomonas sp. TaxID=28214 RepID=UPI001203610C|nr:ATP-binding protein [Sphingomonas sp.]THD35270.1 MAG: ATPase [Sphingomonas sp.]